MEDVLNTTTKMDKKKRGFFHKLTTLFLAGVFLFSAFKVGTIGKEYYDNRKILGQVQKIFAESKEIIDDPKSEIRSQFNSLLEINSDIVGWLEIEGTNINYPILHAEDNDYYLKRNYLKEEARAGSIYLDYRNSIEEFSRNNVIYGHRMKDGSMFGQLKKFLDEDFFKNHSKILYDTLYESYELEVFAVYKTTTDFYYIQTDFTSNEEYGHFLNSLKDKSVYKSSSSVGIEDTIITLSTCDYGVDRDEGRLVVHAKLIDKDKRFAK